MLLPSLNQSHSYTFMMKYWSCNWCSHATVPLR